MDFSNPQNTSTDDLFNNLANGLLNGPPQGPTAGELALRGGPFRTGARALITGGAYGIGFATATFCSAWGMKVFVVDDDEATLNSARARAKSDNTLTTEITFMKMDVTNREEWKRVQKIVGVVDFLFLMKQTDVSELEWRNGDGFDEVLRTNLNGVLYGLNAYVPKIEDVTESTAIVILGAQEGLLRKPYSPAFTAGKAAIRALAEQLTLEISGKTAVHLLLPGMYQVGPRGNGPPISSRRPSPHAWEEWQVVDYMYKKMSEGSFYIICPDNGLTEEEIKKRLLWRAGDMLYQRSPMTLFRDDWQTQRTQWYRHEHHIT